MEKFINKNRTKKLVQMTPTQVKLQKKATALNNIRKIYNPLYNDFSHYENDGSYGEQRDSMVKEIISKLEYELKNWNK